MPPPRTISRAIASPRFLAATTSRGSPGPGIRASGVTVPPLTGSAEVAPTDGAGLVLGTAAVPSGETGVVVTADGVELAVAGVDEELLEELGVFFFMPIMRKSPSTTTRTPITAIWTCGF